MINIVKCECSRWVRMPIGVQCMNNSTFPCPVACPHKNGKCKNKTNFKVVQIREMNDADADRLNTEKYSTDEMKSFSSSTKSIEVTSEINKNGEEPGASLGYGFKSFSHAVVDDKNVHNTESTVNDKYGIGGLCASSKRCSSSVSENLPYTSEDSDKIAISGKVYKDCFELGGVIYTNDKTLANYGVQTKPLKNAFMDIFESWDCDAVFEDYIARNLRKQFGWLIVQCCENKIKTSEIETILNMDCDRNKKFFYLFHDLIFKRKPIGRFYFPDKNHRFGIEKVHYRFVDKKDFIYRYCKEDYEGKSFRAFYYENKNEILHFLNYDNSEKKLFEDITLIQARDYKKVVGFNIINEPVFLGTIYEFVEKMQRICNAEEMGQMIEFLNQYRITSDYNIEKRSSYDQPLIQVNAGQRYEDRLFSALGIHKDLSSECATLYERYLCLLREYITVFKPNEIVVGELKFTKRNFSFEIQEVVVNLCKIIFGESNSNDIDMAIGKAFLAKSLYEEDVFKSFPCENKSYIDEIIKIIDKAVPSDTKRGQIDKEDGLKMYFSKIANPLVRFGEEDISITEYIKRQVLYNDILTIHSLLKDDILIRTYLSEIKSKNTRDKLDNTFNKLQELYDKFIAC